MFCNHKQIIEENKAMRALLEGMGYEISYGFQVRKALETKTQGARTYKKKYWRKNANYMCITCGEVVGEKNNLFAHRKKHPDSFSYAKVSTLKRRDKIGMGILQKYVTPDVLNRAIEIADRL
jgi:hypothetical protein